MLLNRSFVGIGIFRAATALPVLRWPFFGGLTALLGDLGDLVLMNYVFVGGLGDYQRCDKLWDLAYMLTFLVAASRWTGLERSIAFGLFGLRATGVGAFLLGAPRPMLLALPNLFEPWFLAVAARDRWAPHWALTKHRAAALLLLVVALKVPQEYLLHLDRRLDTMTLPEFLQLVGSYLGLR